MRRVAVLGASGRMGSEVCRAVDADTELELVAKVGRNDKLQAVSDAGAEVAVDFTRPDAVFENVRFCIENGIHAVVGTTGLRTEQLAEIERWTGESDANAMVAPNFAIGAVLMMQFAARAARFFDVAEVVERHHERKLDAPSGTALRTAALMNESRGRPWGAPSEGDALAGSRGTDIGGIRVHALRAPGFVAHQEVVLGSSGQTLTIRHDSIDRASFMPGVILAVKKVDSLDGLTVGLENLLDL